MKKLSDCDRHNENPFIGIDRIELARKTDVFGTDSIVVQKGTGELQGMGLIARHRQVDGDRFIKLFTDKIGLWLDLSKRGLKILCYVIGALKNNRDKIYIHMETLQEYTGYNSEAPIYSGLAELIDRKILARSTYANVYYINPHYLFNGDRVLFLESFERKTSEAEELAMLIGDNAVLEVPEAEDVADE